MQRSPQKVCCDPAWRNNPVPPDGFPGLLPFCGRLYRSPGISQGGRSRMAHKRIIHNTRVFNMHGGAVNSRWTPITGSGGARRICRSIHIKNTLLLKDIRPRNIPGSYCCTVFSDCDALISFLQGKRGTQNENLQGVNALGRAYPISTNGKKETS